MKKCALFLFILFLSTELVFSQVSENTKKFIKGNLTDKTEALKSASGKDIEELSLKAIDFSLQNKSLLGNDRELTALAVSGILSVPQSYLDALSEKQKLDFSDNLLELYNIFEDETVKIAVLDRVSKMNVPSEKFKKMLDEYILNCSLTSENKVIISSAIQTLGLIGDSSSFKILLEKSKKEEWKNYSSELEQSLGSLCVNAENELIDSISTGNTSDCRKIFELCVKNQKNNQIFTAKISENVLLRTIYIYESTGSASEDLVSLEMDSFNLLTELKWTRAGETTIKFLNTSLKEFENSQMSEKDFCKVIEGMAYTSPIESVQYLSSYLAKLNGKMEKESSSVSEPVVLSIIKTLGTIGDKNAFDSLLAVAYYNYSETVRARAQEALTKLKW